MAIKSKIIAVHEDQGSIEVVYIDEATGAQAGPWAIDLPIVNGQYPSGEELDKIIDGYLPAGFFERAVAVAARPDMSHIAAMVGREREANLNVFTTRAELVGG